MAIKESFHFKMDRKVAVFTKDRKSMKEELARRKLDCTLNKSQLYSFFKLINICI